MSINNSGIEMFRLFRNITDSGTYQGYQSYQGYKGYCGDEGYQSVGLHMFSGAAQTSTLYYIYTYITQITYNTMHTIWTHIS